MIYIGIIFCITMLTIGIKFEKKVINPITVFYGLWLIILVLSLLRLFDLRETDNKVYWIITVGLITYSIGYYFQSIFCRRYTFSFKSVNYRLKRYMKKDYVLRYNLIYILGVIIVIFYLYDLSKVFPYLFSGSSLGDIRRLAQDSNSVINSNRSAIENAIRVLIITPGAIALQPIVAADFWIGRRDKRLLLINVSIILLRVITDGSRSLITLFLLHFMIILGFANKNTLKKKIKNKYKKNKKLSTIIIILIGAIVLYKTTLSRSGENIIRFSYYYFSMEPYMFEKWSKIVDSTGIIGYGIASTNGLWFLIFYIVKNVLGFSSYPEHWNIINNFIMATDSQWQVIAGNGITANAYVSLFWFLYLDGRIFGIILGMIIYGMISALIFNKALKRRTVKHICIYSVILQGLAFSFVRLQFADIYYTIVVIFVLIIAYRPVIIRNNGQGIINNTN